MTLGKRLIRFRAENNLSQQKLADMCKISKQTLFMIEKYEISISPLTREKIELVIGKEKKE